MDASLIPRSPLKAWRTRSGPVVAGPAKLRKRDSGFCSAEYLLENEAGAEQHGSRQSGYVVHIQVHDAQSLLQDCPSLGLFLLLPHAKPQRRKA